VSATHSTHKNWGEFNLIGGTSAAATTSFRAMATALSAPGGASVGDPSSSFKTVQGNYVGVDATGTMPLGNTNAGIRFVTAGGSSGNVIGGTTGVTLGRMASGRRKAGC
jgi:hypothetical protein